jgi:hypothetical protein
LAERLPRLHTQCHYRKEQIMKTVGAVLLMSLTVVIFFSFVWPVIGQETSSSRCIECHTDVKKLIRLSWEVEKVRGKPPVSEETEGEG